MGGFASYNAIEIVLYKDYYKDELIIKQLIAHELLHLYFPSISNKFSSCYNEGLLDYLSTILNFSNKDIFHLTDYKMKEYYRFKELLNNTMLKQQRPYFIGYLYGYMMEKKNIKKIINYIKKYIRERQYMLIPWKNKSYIKFIISNLFINKFCKQYLYYKI